MKEIKIDDDIYKHILANIQEFGETPSAILRRLLSIALIKESEPNITIEEVHTARVVAPVSSPVPVQEIVKEPTIEVLESDDSLPESLAHGVKALFASSTFKNESIITNKFKMMLTTMYHENKPAFIVAADSVKGRTRDYLGTNLDKLLASDNAEELVQFKASKPREIPHTPFWVITNANTGRKHIILTQMMASMNYPHHLIERIKDEV